MEPPPTAWHCPICKSIFSNKSQFIKHHSSNIQCGRFYHIYPFDFPMDCYDPVHGPERSKVYDLSRYTAPDDNSTTNTPIQQNQQQDEAASSSSAPDAGLDVQSKDKCREEALQAENDALKKENKKLKKQLLHLSSAAGKKNVGARDPFAGKRNSDVVNGIENYVKCILSRSVVFTPTGQEESEAIQMVWMALKDKLQLESHHELTEDDFSECYGSKVKEVINKKRTDLQANMKKAASGELEFNFGCTSCFS